MIRNKLLFLIVLCFSIGHIHAQEYAEGVALVRVKNSFSGDFKSLTENINYGSSIAGFLKSMEVYDIEYLHLEEAVLYDSTGVFEREFVLYANAPTNILIDSLNRSGFFELVQPNYIYKSFVIPNDDEYGNQWYLEKINMPQAWDIEKGCNHIRIAVLDAGFYPLKHKDVKHKYFPYRYDATDLSPSTPHDDDDVSGVDDDVSDGLAEHGLNVSSVAAAWTDNNRGMAGVGWDIDLVLVRAGYLCDESCNPPNQYFEDDDIIEGIDWIVETTYARIINLSLGATNSSVFLQDCINNAKNAGYIFICSSGNHFSNTSAVVSFPANMENVIAVGASDQNDNPWVFGNYGPELDLIAPGENIKVAYGKKKYTNKSGTSFAAPQVSGVAALVLSLNPYLSFTQVRDVLINTTDRPAGMQNANFTNTYGYGRLNAYKSLKAVKRIAPDVYVYNESPDRIQIVYAQNRIFSGDYPIHNECLAEFRAGSSIHLQDGFHAEAGSYFHAYIADVGPPCVSYRTQMVNDSSFSESSGSGEIDIAQNISLVQNPVHNNVEVRFTGFSEGEILSFLVFNGSGSVVISQGSILSAQGAFVHEIDVSGLVPSNYFLIICNNENSWPLPFIKM